MQAKEGKERVLSVLDLPTEVMLEIFGWIGNAYELCTLSLVCKSFYTIACDDSLWVPLSNPNWNPATAGGWKKAYIEWIRKAIQHKKLKLTLKAKSFSEVYPNNDPKVPPSWDYLVRVVSIGDSGVGKTSIMRRFTDDTFSEETFAGIGVDFKLKTLDVDGQTIKAQIWDTAGQERFRALNAAYYRGVHGILLVYDITEMYSFDNLRSWKREVDQHAANSVKLFIGNKVDLEDQRVVDKSKAEDYASAQGLPYLETSAKTGLNVDTAYVSVIETIMRGTSFGYEVGDMPRHIPSNDILKRFETSAVQSEKQPDNNKTTQKNKSCLLQ